MTDHAWHPCDDWQTCKVCGMVKRSDGKDRPCRGKVAIGLRKGRPPLLRGHDPSKAIGRFNGMAEEEGKPSG